MQSNVLSRRARHSQSLGKEAATTRLLSSARDSASPARVPSVWRDLKKATACLPHGFERPGPRRSLDIAARDLASWRRSACVDGAADRARRNLAARRRSLYFRDPAATWSSSSPRASGVCRQAGEPVRNRRDSLDVRVLMTGGYGCIGTWVAKQLCEAGQEVWIYDLKEDTHRLDLVLDPSRRRRSTSCKATSPMPMPCARPSYGWGDAISCTWRGCKRPRAGPTRSWARRST